MHLITPASPAEAQALATQWGSKAVFVAGSTIVQQAWTGPRLAPDDQCFINLMAWPETQQISVDDQYLVLGAQTRLEDVRTHPLAQTHAPLLCTALAQLGALGIRRLGTLGGNICWGVGDTGPVLLVLDAQVLLADGSWQPLVEVLQRATLPLMLAFRMLRTDKQPALHTAFEKVGYRAAFTPARVRVAMRWSRAERGTALSHAAAGAPGTPIRRLRHLEQHMAQAGNSCTLASIRAACAQDLPTPLALMVSRLVAGHCGLL